MSKWFGFAIFVITLSLLTSCKHPSDSDTKIVYDTLRGDIIGKAFLSDSSSHGGNVGILVELEGTHYSAFTNSYGDWKIANVPAGIYDIRMTYPDYSAYEQFQISFDGNGTLQ